MASRRKLMGHTLDLGRWRIEVFKAGNLYSVEFFELGSSIKQETIQAESLYEAKKYAKESFKIYLENYIDLANLTLQLMEGIK